MSAVITVQNLSKTYPGDPPHQALAPINLDLDAGEIVVLLGPNGAGKTTLLKILATLVYPSAGKATIAGHSLQESQAIRRNIGMVSDPDRSFFWRLNARQNLEFFALGYGLPKQAIQARISELNEALNLTELAAKPVGKLSSGQRGRLALARALLHRPPVLLLDEPTRSLDPAAANDFLTLLTKYREIRPGASILLSTHRLDAISPFCERLLLLFEGHLRADGTPEALLERSNLPKESSATENLRALYNHYAESEVSSGN